MRQAPLAEADGAASYSARLRNAGILPTDDDDTRLSKSLLVFATGLVSVAAGLWLLIYWSMGPRLSSTLTLTFQLLLAANLALYLKSGHFAWFRLTQLALFLFFPFVAQWSIGNFITGSGLILWGLLAPIGAALCMGARESTPWFFAYLFLTGLTGFFDYYLAELASPEAAQIPIRTSVVFFVLNFATISIIVYALLRFSIGQKRIAEDRLRQAHTDLLEEQARSERLLLNILPAPIARRLKDSNETIADGFPEVTVMFADIVNFTQLAGDMTAQQVFRMLNGVFSRFDELADEQGLEKIKTIGDAYMVAGGLSQGQSDAPAAIARLALAMGDAARACDAHPEVALRIGICTGPVVAGVVGRKKFIYDLWGDTVNIASRLSSEGKPGGILCDARTRTLLAQSFRFDSPEVVSLKGKGPVTISRLLGPC
ncbi:MAG: adenylate/guanylate cyclase domain-containing protein [Rhodocyclaceae bacterium]|nr:adenylate/guanylate cyclase domain-containing protein [Rhodocyclaceae bacterium]